MKRLAAIIVILFSAVSLFSQSITLDNEEDALFLFEVIDTETVPEPPRLRSAVEARIQRSSPRYVPPKGVLADTPVGEGRTIVGVFVDPGRSEYPVVLLDEPTADYVDVSGDDLYRDDDGNVATLPAPLIQKALDGKPVIIDNDYSDWSNYRPLASFSPGFSPGAFEQTRAGRSHERTLSESFYWGKAGTRVAELKGVTSREAAYLMLETRDAVTPGVSYYLYAYHGRDRNRASATVEIAVTGGANGFVFLWLPGREKPHIVGEFVHDRFYLEARVDFSRLPVAIREELSSDAVEQLTFDFATAYSGARVGEEFFYTTLYARDIVQQNSTGLSGL